MLRERLKRIPVFSIANMVLKSQLQERRADFELAYYRSEAESRGIKCLQGEALKRSLRSRLARRGCVPISKPRGELHIFLACCVSNWEAVLPQVLKRFGRLTVFDWKDYGFDENGLDWVGRRDEMNDALLSAYYEANKGQPIDAIVGYLSGHNTSAQTVRRLGAGKAVFFNFCWDDKLGFRGERLGGRWTGPAHLAPSVDLNLTNSPSCCIKYFVEGGLSLFWPEAADPDVHKPCQEDFAYDVSFVGGRYGWRPVFVSKLRKMGIKITCFGNGWKNGSLSNEEMVRLYSRSRINLGFGGVGYSKRLVCLKGRDFEVPMSGGLYVTEDNPDLAFLYDVGREIITYKDERDCGRKIRRLLAHPDQAEKIRKAGRKRALRDHTWERRFQRVFSMAGLLEIPALEGPH